MDKMLLTAKRLAMKPKLWDLPNDQFRQNDDKIVDSISIVKKLEWRLKACREPLSFEFLTGKFKGSFC